MSKGKLGSSIGRADLVEIYSSLGLENLTRCASLLGFEHCPKPSEIPNENAGGGGESGQQKEEDSNSVEITATKVPPLQIIVVTKVRTHEDSTSEAETIVSSVSDSEVAVQVPASLCRKRFHALAPWASIWPAIHGFLSQSQSGGGQIDEKQLVRQLAHLNCVSRIPRHHRSTWAGYAQIWMDFAHQLIPLLDDMQQLTRAIISVRGQAGLRIKAVTDGVIDEVLGPNMGPILILSDLGLYGRNHDNLQNWVNLGKQLHRLQQRPVVLMPCPPALWPANLHRYYDLIFWDRHSSYKPKKSTHKEITLDERIRLLDQWASEILTRLVPAVRVEHDLLRAVRLLEPNFTVAHEMAAWGSGRVDRTRLGFAFASEVSAKVDKREYEEAFSKLDLAEQSKIYQVIEGFHAELPEGIRIEEALNYKILSGADAQLEQDYFVSKIRKVTASSDKHTGLERTKSWLSRIVYRFPYGARKEHAVFYNKLVSVADNELKNKSLPLPGNLDYSRYSLSNRSGLTPRRKVLLQSGSHLILRNSSSESPSIPLFPLGIWGDEFKYSYLTKTGDVQVEELVNLAAEPEFAFPLNQFGANGPNLELVIDNGQKTIHLQAIQRPSWANRMTRTRSGVVAQLMWCGQSYEILWQSQELGDEGPWSWVFSTPFGTDQYGLYADLNVKNITHRFRWINPGTFMMGSPESEEGRFDNETLHQVTLTRGFWLGETAVTQALWQAVMGDNPSAFKGENLPVENVSWEDCQKFIKKLNNFISDLNARLPTEAEWEYACRAGSRAPYFWGDTVDVNHANFGESSFQLTCDVKMYCPNPWGLYQMHGNVWERCHDWYHTVYDAPDVVDPQGARFGDFRVLRGGSWRNSSRELRSAYRGKDRPESRLGRIGMRLVLGRPSQSGGSEKRVEAHQPQVATAKGEAETGVVSRLKKKFSRQPNSEGL